MDERRARDAQRVNRLRRCGRDALGVTQRRRSGTKRDLRSFAAPSRRAPRNGWADGLGGRAGRPTVETRASRPARRRRVRAARRCSARRAAGPSHCTPTSAARESASSRAGECDRLLAHDARTLFRSAVALRAGLSTRPLHRRHQSAHGAVARAVQLPEHVRRDRVEPPDGADAIARTPVATCTTSSRSRHAWR